MNATGKYVITRYDYDHGSVPIPGKAFDDINEACAEAARLEKGARYSNQFLMVDLASAFQPFGHRGRRSL